MSKTILAILAMLASLALSACAVDFKDARQADPYQRSKTEAMGASGKAAILGGVGAVDSGPTE